MTTLMMQSRSELSELSTLSSQDARSIPVAGTSTARTLATVIRLPILQDAAQTLPKGVVRIGDLVKDLESNPETAQQLIEAREELAQDYESGGRFELRRLRLSKGLSQAALAALVGTSQSHIARLETGNHDANVDTLKRIGVALDVNVHHILDAFLAVRTA